MRSLTPLLAAVPMLTLCFLIGGVDWKQAAMSAMTNFSAILVALSGGILASAVCEKWNRAMTCAGFVTAGLALMEGVLLATSYNLHILPKWGFTVPELYSALRHLGAGASGWGFLSGSTPGFQPIDLWFMGAESVAVGVVVLLISVQLAGWLVGRTWRTEPPSTRQVRWQNTFLKPRFGMTFFRRHMNRALDRNPVG